MYELMVLWNSMDYYGLVKNNCCTQQVTNMIVPHDIVKV